MYIYIYIYTYIYKYISICVYIYIYIHIYRERERERERERRLVTVTLHTDIMDFIGFDSSTILILRGGIPRPMGKLPESLSQAILVGIMLVGRFGVSLLIITSDLETNEVDPRSHLITPCQCIQGVRLLETL